METLGPHQHPSLHLRCRRMRQGILVKTGSLTLGSPVQMSMGKGSHFASQSLTCIRDPLMKGAFGPSDVSPAHRPSLMMRSSRSTICPCLTMAS